MNRMSRQKGSVSLFIVIFAALLIITIGTAFIRIMIQGQSQATADDLSRSALDSANAGVEDVKRIIAQYNDAKCSENMANANCLTLVKGLYGNGGADTTGASQTDGCDATIKAGIASNTTGPVVQVSSDKGLQQSYTCVKVQMNTDSYVGTLVQNQSRLIHLKSVAGQAFDTVDIKWFSQKDLSGAAGPTGTISLESTATKKLYSADAVGGVSDSDTWPHNRPSVLRTQVLQFDTGNTDPAKDGSAGFKLTDFDKRLSDYQNGDPAKLAAGTMFLYPFGGSGAPLTFRIGVDDPLQSVGCLSTFATTGTGLYACEAKIQLPQPILADATDTHDAYLRLLAPYNTATDFQVQLLNGGNPTPVLFGGVQPRVDSTGRANDLYRRVRSYLEPSGNGLPYVEGALDISGDLCKAFTIGTTTADYSADTNCRP